MTVRLESAESRREVRGSTTKSSHACGRRRGGELAVSWHAEPGGPGVYSCSTLMGARRDAERAPRLCAAEPMRRPEPKGRARRPKVRHSGESAIAAEVFMNKAGYELIAGFGERNRDGHRGRVQRW